MPLPSHPEIQALFCIVKWSFSYATDQTDIEWQNTLIILQISHIFSWQMCDVCVMISLMRRTQNKSNVLYLCNDISCDGHRMRQMCDICVMICPEQSRYGHYILSDAMRRRRDGNLSRSGFGIYCWKFKLLNCVGSGIVFYKSHELYCIKNAINVMCNLVTVTLVTCECHCLTLTHIHKSHFSLLNLWEAQNVWICSMLFLNIIILRSVFVLHCYLVNTVNN